MKVSVISGLVAIILFILILALTGGLHDRDSGPANDAGAAPVHPELRELPRQHRGERRVHGVWTNEEVPAACRMGSSELCTGGR